VPNKTTRRGESVLIVEDDARTRAALVVLLGQFGYDVVPVATVAEGVARLDGQSRAILDLNLPDGLGTHILARIRNEGRPIRVAVTTGTMDESLVDEARRMDAELILRKPINVKTLIEWLERDG
jgi:CheY-like chemotaxis protein